MKHTTLLTKRVNFAASHRYWNPNWSEEKNREVFGKCVSPYGHGHNYTLEVTIKGEPDPENGMIINLYDLSPIIGDVLRDYDHKFLNEDNPEFRDLIPTTENIARVLWRRLEEKINSRPGCELYRLRLYETDDLFVELRREQR